jgi:ubiquinone/menaquinone biosynthesis C-methylase UbiE
MVSDFITYYQSEFGKKVLDRESQFIKKHLQRRTNILDVGCGIGIFEQTLNQLPITGLDIDPLFLEEAKQRSRNRFVHGDVTNMEFETESFDGVFSVTTLEFIPDLPLALKEIHRVLKPNGKIVFLILNTKSNYFQTQSDRANSYFQKIAHDHQKVLHHVQMSFTTKQGYMLGIDGMEVFETSDPKWAAIFTIVGKKSRSRKNESTPQA